MAEAARVGDVADADEAGHAAAIDGSPDVFFNGVGALRLDDGGPGWQAVAGSSGVFINGKPAVRAGDATSHGAALGVLVAGSPDVALGDAGAGTPAAKPHDQSMTVSFVDALGRSVQDAVVDVFCPHQPPSQQTVSGSATLSGLCSSATVTVHKSLQGGEWDDNASQGSSPITIMSAPTTRSASLTGGVQAPDPGAPASSSASASTSSLTVHAPGPSGTAPSQRTVTVPPSGNGGTTVVQYTTVHNWMQLVYHAFGHNLPTEDMHLALLGMREASLSGPGRSGEAHDVELEQEAAHGDLQHVSFTREPVSQSYNDLLFCAWADKHVATKQVVDAYECTIDASASHGKLHLPYILEGKVIHAAPGPFESYPGKHSALHLFKGNHEPHAPTGGGTVKAVLDLAHKQLGTMEHPLGSNDTKYNAWYGAEGVAWCAMFVSWVFTHAGIPLIHYEGCPDGGSRFQSGEWGTWHDNRSTAHPGDIVFYDWEPDGTYDHTGIVVSDHGSYIYAIEGNTSDPNGNPNEDWGVYYKQRDKGLIAGFGRTHFKTTAPPVPVIRWGGNGKRVKEKSEKNSTLLHHPYFETKHGKHVVGPQAKRYEHFIGTYEHAKNKSSIPYLVVSSRYVKTYAEWVKWVEQNPGVVPTARSVLRESGLHSPDGMSKRFIPSFMSKGYVDRVLNHLHGMHDRHHAHELRDELEGALLELAVKLD